MGYNSIRPLAVAYIHGSTSAGPTGTVSFCPYGGNTLVVADIRQLPQDEALCSSQIFGFHVHEGDSCGGVAFSDTKGHFNPKGCQHPYHAGDLPPLFECNGHAFMAVLTSRFQIADIIGRTVVIHSQPDDFTSQPAGNSGAKIACGVIQAVPHTTAP